MPIWTVGPCHILVLPGRVGCVSSRSLAGMGSAPVYPGALWTKWTPDTTAPGETGPLEPASGGLAADVGGGTAYGE